MNKNEEKIKELCRTASADINLCRVAYEIIDHASENEKPSLFQTFAIFFKHSPTDESLKLPTLIEDTLKAELIKRYGMQVDIFLDNLLHQELSEKVFYKKLWEYISESPTLPSVNARAFALFNCLFDNNIPYFNLDRRAALSMTPDEFKSHLASVGAETLGRMEFTLSAPFSQLTEQASLIINMLDKLKNYEDRTVLLARLIGFFRREIDKREFIRTLESRRCSDRPKASGDDDIVSGLDIDDLLFDDDDSTASW